MTVVQLRGLLQRIEGRYSDLPHDQAGPHDNVLRDMVAQALGDRPLASIGPRPTGAPRLTLQA